MKVKYSYIISSLLILISFFLPLQPTAHAAFNNDVVQISKVSYMQEQIDNDILYRLALEGKLVNNETTQVTTYSLQDNTTVVEIRKLTDRTLLSNGKIVKNYAVATTGTKSESGDSGSTTVGLTVGFNYEKIIIANTSCYKPTYMFVTPYLYDNRFRLYSVSDSLNGSGTGYTASGTATFCLFSDTLGPISYPSSGVQNSKNVFYNYYLNLNDGSGFGTIGNVIYQRIDTGATYTFSLNVSM